MNNSRRIPIIPCLARLAALLALPALSVFVIVAIRDFDNRVARQPVHVPAQATDARDAVSLLAPRG